MYEEFIFLQRHRKEDLTTENTESTEKRNISSCQNAKNAME
jgi:hypothetical protein